MVNRTTKQRCEQSLNFTFGQSIRRYSNYFVFWHVSTKTNPRQLSCDNRIALFTIASRPISITYLAVSLPADKTRLNSGIESAASVIPYVQFLPCINRNTASQEALFRRRCYFVDGRRRCFDEICAAWKSVRIDRLGNETKRIVRARASCCAEKFSATSVRASMRS